MPNLHILASMIDRIRAFLVVVEEGSVNRAATRLRVTQPALSRQMKSLENEIGGKLLEREASGVKPTSLGHALIKSMRPLVQRYDTALSDARKLARGIRSELRVGYLISAGPSLVTPALARFRKSHRELKLKLHDMSPREQIVALRAGELDIALVGQEGAAAARDFYSLKLHSFDVVAALSTTDPLARRKEIHLRDLNKHPFIGVDEHEVPGRNRWMIALCRKAGFKPRFLVVTDGITNVLSEVVSEGGVTLLPGYFRNFSHPDIVFVPIADAHARWDCIVLWQRGNPPPAARALVEALAATARAIGER